MKDELHAGEMMIKTISTNYNLVKKRSVPCKSVKAGFTRCVITLQIMSRNHH